MLKLNFVRNGLTGYWFDNKSGWYYAKKAIRTFHLAWINA